VLLAQCGAEKGIVIEVDDKNTSMLLIQSLLDRNRALYRTPLRFVRWIAKRFVRFGWTPSDIA
jgi:hypothetical protein